VGKSLGGWGCAICMPDVERLQARCTSCPPRHRAFARPQNPLALLPGWHQLKHGSKAARGNREQKQSLGELIRLHCQVGARLCDAPALPCCCGASSLLSPLHFRVACLPSPRPPHSIVLTPLPPVSPCPQATNYLLGKVAVQCLGPAMLYLGMGLLLLDAGESGL